MPRVPINPKLLNEGERVVVSTRTHVKVLLGPLLVLLLVAFAASYLAAVVGRQVDDDTLRTAAHLTLAALGVAALVAWVVRPFLTWFFTTYTFTDRRFIQRSGIIAKVGRTIPLNRISGVDFEMGVVDRIFGCGTLVVSDASEQGRVPVRDVPRVEDVQRQVAAELHALGREDSHRDDGT